MVSVPGSARRKPVELTLPILWCMNGVSTRVCEELTLPVLWCVNGDSTRVCKEQTSRVNITRTLVREWWQCHWRRVRHLDSSNGGVYATMWTSRSSIHAALLGDEAIASIFWDEEPRLDLVSQDTEVVLKYKASPTTMIPGWCHNDFIP